MRPPAEPGSSSSLSVREMRLRSGSASSTLTRTTWPDFTISRGSETNLLDRAETCTRPSWCTPTSTKAPNAATLVTVPSRIMPGLRSEIFSMPSENDAALNAGRGSRPGFSSSDMMSLTVGRPKVPSTNACGSSAVAGPPPAATRILRATEYASGCTLEASRGSAPPVMRRKPAHCSNALAPNRGTFLRSLRLANGPFSFR
ncbi:hypothetical protein PJL18_04288 [Paenarthrobacter nicotinovorans]|nr:hypothetical protein [Paenarthrobacter nicotinovorans]